MFNVLKRPSYIFTIYLCDDDNKNTFYMYMSTLPQAKLETHMHTDRLIKKKQTLFNLKIEKKINTSKKTCHDAATRFKII